MEKRKAVVILSGGLDSATCLGLAEKEGYDVFPITFSYGQRHNKEVDNAKSLVKYYGIQDHKIIDLDFLSKIGGSSLTDHNLAIDVNKAKDDTVPNTYVPGRNMIFISIASSYAESIGAERIYIGVSSIDYSGYPDCRPNFIEAMQKAIIQGTNNNNIELRVPLINLTKAATVELGIDLNVPYELTTSCYKGGTKACGECDSCRLRLQGFKESGNIDPIEYEIVVRSVE